MLIIYRVVAHICLPIHIGNRWHAQTFNDHPINVIVNRREKVSFLLSYTMLTLLCGVVFVVQVMLTLLLYHKFSLIQAKLQE